MREETAKLYLIWKTLTLRRRRPDAFEGSYEPLDAGTGMCAYLRGGTIAVAVPTRPDAVYSPPPGFRDALGHVDLGVYLLERAGDDQVGDAGSHALRRGVGGSVIGRLGARPVGADVVEFRVWAPNATDVRVGDDQLTAEDEGIFAATLEAEVGSSYGFSLDGASPIPDPCSRWQPGGLRGLSRILDTNEFTWTSEPIRLSLERLVVYELHVGTFTQEGTFEAAIPRLGTWPLSGSPRSS